MRAPAGARAQVNLEHTKLRKAWLKGTVEGLYAEVKPYLNNTEYMEGVKMAGLVRAAIEFRSGGPSPMGPLRQNPAASPEKVLRAIC